MIKSLKLLLLFLLPTCVLVWISLSISLQAEHKICDGAQINEIQDKTFQITFNEQRLLLTISGAFEIGLVSAFEKQLDQYPQTKGVIFNSHGGNVYQARGLAMLIDQYALNTYSFDTCYSACTLAYLAGKKRFLGPNAKLGFHRYHLDLNDNSPVIDIQKEQQKDMLFYKKHIPSSEFIEKIFNAECTEIWTPDTEELLNSGVIDFLINFED